MFSNRYYEKCGVCGKDNKNNPYTRFTTTAMWGDLCQTCFNRKLRENKIGKWSPVKYKQKVEEPEPSQSEKDYNERRWGLESRIDELERMIEACPRNDGLFVEGLIKEKKELVNELVELIEGKEVSCTN